MKRKCLYSFAVQCVGKCLKQPNFLPMVDCNCIRKFSWKITELDNTGKSKLDFFISNLMTVQSLHSNKYVMTFPLLSTSASIYKSSQHFKQNYRSAFLSRDPFKTLFDTKIITENKWMCRNRSYYHYYHHHQHQNCHTPNIVEV